MRVTLLHNAVSDSATADEQDVLVQHAAVKEALTLLGHEHSTITCTGELDLLGPALLQEHPEMVFNLVEMVNGSERLAHVIPALLDTHAIPYTGPSDRTLLLTNNKIRTKQYLRRAGLPTPPWFTVRNTETFRGRSTTFIIKSIHEHGSYGIHDSSIITCARGTTLKRHILRANAINRKPCFAEEFIDGREFNISLLADATGSPQVLPPAEIDFSAFPEGKPHIVNFEAKWQSESFEYSHTPWYFSHKQKDTALLRILEELACSCWNLFRLRGYARVEFRIDPAGNPWIMEVNSNPCLSPDADFAAAIKHAGISFPEAIGRILASCN